MASNEARSAAGVQHQPDPVANVHRTSVASAPLRRGRRGRLPIVPAGRRHHARHRRLRRCHTQRRDGKGGGSGGRVLPHLFHPPQPDQVQRGHRV